MTDQPAAIAALLIPMLGRPWLLPNIMVAEIVPMTSLTSGSLAPPYLSGWLAWRGLQVPVVTFELPDSARIKVNAAGAKLIVLHSNSAKYPFYAVISQGVPRIAKVTPDDLCREPATANPAEAMHVSVNGELAVIPDLDKIDAQLQLLDPL